MKLKYKYKYECIGRINSAIRRKICEQLRVAAVVKAECGRQ